MKKIVMSLIVALVILSATACKQAPKLSLADGEWVLTAWLDETGEEQMVTANRPTMMFTTESKVSGMAGCNHFSGTYTVDGQNLTVDMGALTRKMCLDMTLENRMVGQMPNVAAYKIDGNQLILSNKEGKELFRFDNAAAPQPAAQ